MNESTMKPLVSIIIPVYNGERFMREAIDSALAQDYENKEIIVVNDGSTDGGVTEEIALSYGDSIRYLKKENGGVSSALNLGIANMKGEYFSWLSHDDKYLPNKVSITMEALLKYEDKNLIGLCEIRQINADSKPLEELRTRKRFHEGIVIDWREVLTELFAYGCFNGCALMIPREVFERCGGFCEELRYAQDWLMWLKVFLEEYSLVYTSEVAVESRVHAGQLTNTGIALFHKDSQRISEMLLPSLIQKSDKENNFLYMFACNNARYNNKTVVRDCLREGISEGLLSFGQEMKIRFLSLYGRIRPLIRKIYYKIVKRV